jgi:Zn-dependent protease with chaperone function
MNQKEFEDLVKRLELSSRKNPSVYTLRVALLAALGYLFLFSILASSAGLVALVIYVGKVNYLIIKLLIIPLALAAIVLRSMWIKFPEPEGKPIRRTDAPRLFDLVNQVRTATNGPEVHKLLLTGDLNAGIVQRPRLGMLGWHENYLLIGLPLLHALSLQEFRAVLAHEFGHLSGNHSRFAGWIYRLRQTWTQILQNIQHNRRRGAEVIFEKFFNWYAPYFSAYSFVLARVQEYEADRCALQLSGKQVAAQALIKMELKSCVIERKFLPDLFKKADEESDPPKDAFTRMLSALSEPIAEDERKLWLGQCLMRRHNYDDTHPALVDRLAALGYTDLKDAASIEEFALDESAHTADSQLLNFAPADLIGMRNRTWVERVRPQWEQRYQFVREAEKSLSELAQKAESRSLTIEEMWERARFTVGTKGHEPAIPILRELLQQQSDHAAANFTLGEALLAQQDDAGIKNIEHAMLIDMSAVPAGCQLIYGFLTQKGRADEAEKYRQRAQEYYLEAEQARIERQNINAKDHFKPHNLPAEKLRHLREQLAAFSRVRVAYLVQKDVKHFPHDPGYVLGIIPKFPWYALTTNGASQKLVEQIASQVQYAGYTYIIALEKNYRPLRRKFKRIAGAEILKA